MPRQTRKLRLPIADEVSGKLLYDNHHTCCVCNVENVPVQIHHIDENPANNSIENLAVLCLPCHDKTQIVGGFGRKLSSKEVAIYRANWIERVQRRRNEADRQAIEYAGARTFAIALASETVGNDVEPVNFDDELGSGAVEAALFAYIDHLPHALTTLYNAEWERLMDGPQQEQTLATMRVADVLERMWLIIIRDYPNDRFAPNPQERISKFRADRGSFHWDLARQDNGWPGSIVTTMVGWSVLRDMERVIEDTVRALTRFSEYDLPSWENRWSRATFDSRRGHPGIVERIVRLFAKFKWT